MSYKEGELTFRADATLAANRRVKIDSSKSTADPARVVYAGAGEDYIGVTQYSAATDDLIAVKPAGADGSLAICAKLSSAITPGVVLYGAALGKVSDASSGSAQGVALATTAVSDAVIEVAPWGVKSTTGATVSIADAGNYTAAATVEAALQEVYKHLLNAEGFIPVPLAVLKTSTTVFVSGTSAVTSALATDTTPKIGRLGATGTTSAQVISWATGDVGAIWGQITVPPDFDDDAVCYLKARVNVTAGTNVPTFTVRTFWNETGTVISDSLAASTATTTWGEVSATIAAADIPAGAAIFTFSVTPAAHTVSVWKMSALWFEYKRKILSA